MVYLNIDNWNRKNQFYFFKDYDNPFFNICANVDVSRLVNYTKVNNISYFKSVLYLSLRSANRIEEFRYRMREDKVIIHKIIHCGSTILNEDETFSFCYFDYHESFKEFTDSTAQKLEKHKVDSSALDPQDDRDDLIHYSVIPWISFTSFSHARKSKSGDSIPKIVFGKYFTEKDRTKMPISIQVHHALMDGIHVGKFLSSFQSYLNSPEINLT